MAAFVPLCCVPGFQHSRRVGFITGAKVVTLIAAICLWEVQAVAADGLITLRSDYAPQKRMDRLETEVKATAWACLLESIMRQEPQKLDCRCGRPSFSSLAMPRAARR